jgi:hypothetical protein
MAALYRSLSPTNTADYEYRTLSIHEIRAKCNGLTIINKRLLLIISLAREGVEPPTTAFSELIVPVFPRTSMVVVGLLNTGKYEKNEWIVGDRRGDYKAKEGLIEICEICALAHCRRSRSRSTPLTPRILEVAMSSWVRPATYKQAAPPRSRP